MPHPKKSFLLGTAAAGAALCASAFFSILAVQAACTNPSPLPSGFAAPCPVFSLSATTITQSQTLTLSATPQAGTDYIYTTTYVSEGTTWNPYTLSGNNAYPSYSSALASLTLSSTQLQSLSLGTHYAVVWDWLWDSTAQCYKGPGLNQCNTGTWRVQSFSLTSAATPTPTPTPPACLTSSTTWQNQAIVSQTGSFEITYDATPNLNLMDGLTGLSHGIATANTDAAVMVWFNTFGNIQARNGSAYQAQATIPYIAGSTYHLRLDVNVPTHTYSAYVTPPGQTEKTIGTNYAFRTEQATASSLNYWNLQANTGSHMVCNIKVSSIAYTYSQSTYYAYSQSAYYSYSQAAYYVYSQSSYYAYSQSAYTSGCTSNCYYVSPTGSDSNSGSVSAPWKTINHAARAVGAGATVIVEDGTYAEALSLTISGTASSRITFQAQNKWGAIIAPATLTADNSIISVGGQYITISGFEITTNNQNVAYGIRQSCISSCGQGLIVMSNKIHHIDAGSGAPCTRGAAIGPFQNSTVIGNLIYDVSPPRSAAHCYYMHGIYAQGGPNTIANNIIGEIWQGYAIQEANDQSTVDFHGVHVVNNTLFNNGTVAGDGAQSGGGMYMNCPGSTNGNQCSDWVIANNIIMDNVASGGVCFSNEYTTGTLQTITNNMRYNCGSSTFAAGSGWTNDSTANPLLVNYVNDGIGNYHLQSNSPAINAGTSNGAPATDFDGISRPQPAGGAYDIGAYEWH